MPSYGRRPYDSGLDTGIPWYSRHWYSERFKYSHFYGGTFDYPFSKFPLKDLYKSAWLDRPYHYQYSADWYR